MNTLLTIAFCGTVLMITVIGNYVIDIKQNQETIYPCLKDNSCIKTNNQCSINNKEENQ